MKENPIRKELLISAQRALLGMIYPSIRAIGVASEGVEKLKIICYLDKQPDEDDYENLGEIAGYIMGDIDFESVEEICQYTSLPLSKLDPLDTFIYMRKEI